MALRRLLAFSEIRTEQYSVRLHIRRVATSQSPGFGSIEFRVPVPWGIIAGQGENSILFSSTILLNIYSAEKKSLYVVARMLQTSPGRSDKQQQ